MLKDRTGEIRIMNNGLKATVIAYRKSADIDVRFENGEIVLNCEYPNFKRGSIKCPMIIEKIGGCAKVTNITTKAVTTFLIDIEDLEVLDGFLWNVSDKNYIQNRICGKLHRLITKAKDGEFVDHINHDTLDNRKQNLRICTRSENGCNRHATISNESGYKGVGQKKGRSGKSDRWLAQICINGQNMHIGYFDNKEEAGKAYNEAAIKYHGEFAELNIIP